MLYAHHFGGHLMNRIVISREFRTEKLKLFIAFPEVINLKSWENRTIHLKLPTPMCKPSQKTTVKKARNRNFITVR